MTPTDYACAALLLHVVVLLVMCRETPADRERHRLQRWRPERNNKETSND